MSGVKLRSVTSLREPAQQSQSRVSFKDDVDISPKEAPDHKATREDKNIPVGKLTRFGRGIRGFWTTTTMYDDADADRDSFIRTTIRELVVYLGFVVTLCLVAFLMLDSNMFYLTKVMQGLFVDGPGFDSITNMKAFWKYAEGDLINGLYKEQYYDGADVHHTEIGYIFFENKLFGRPRFRQIRVRNDTCKIHKDMVSEFNECYGVYKLDHEEQIQNFRGLNGTAWNYKSKDDLTGRSFSGRRASYEGGGYTQLLSDKKLESQLIVANLKKGRWLDRGTRAVFIDFTVYNANINMFNIVRLLFEFTPTGGCITYRRLSTIKLLRYVTSTDYFVMACEGILFLYLIFYTIEEIMEMKKLKWKYLKEFWTCLDLVVILCGFSLLAMNMYRTFKVSTVLKDILDNRDRFANFEILQYWQELFNDIVAVTCFFGWIKIFKYISFNKTMGHLTGTLKRSAKDVAAFVIMFLIVFFAFAHWGFLAFGTHARDFNEFVSCLFTLFRVILGDFDFNAMYEANWVWGPIYFICYIFFVFFVLLNMFLAIINDTYAEVKEDDDDEEVDVGGIFKKGYDKMLTSLAMKKDNIADIREALVSADTNDDDMLDYEEWRVALKARGHHDGEIEAVFAKYDVDGDRTLNAMELEKMRSDFDAQTEDLDEEMEEVKQSKADAKRIISKLNMRDEDAELESDDESDADSETSVPQRVGYDEFKVLIRRVDSAEHSVGSIVSKIEAVLLKLETMDKAKAKRRETMARLIDSISEYEDKVEDADEILAAEDSASWGSESTLKQGASKLSLSTGTPKGSSFLRPKSNATRKGSKGSKGSTLSIKVDDSK